MNKYLDFENDIENIDIQINKLKSNENDFALKKNKLIGLMNKSKAP